jgi:RNA polymerase sigma-70 factor (ECF subfamily)
VDLEARARLEEKIRSLCISADYGAAAEAAIRGYGPELMGFLLGVHGSEVEATDAFADLCEVLWRRLPGFAWESTVRAWAYGIARNVSRSQGRNSARRRRRENPVTDSLLDQITHAVRTETLSYLRTHKRTRLLSLRDELTEEDRMLLILRVDRELEWNDLVRVMAGRDDGAPLDEAFVKKEAARLRKRFQLIKERLRETAKRAGLIP